MSGSARLSRGELVALVEQQARVIEELRAEVAELKRRLGQNSQPPSADGPAAPARRVSRRRSGRRTGKQPGAGGSALLQVTDPDQVVDHVPGACPGCGADLAGATDAGVVRRQVYDIPVITATVTEHRLHRRVCGCGRVVTAATPAGVTAAATYGPNLRALAA